MRVTRDVKEKETKLNGYIDLSIASARTIMSAVVFMVIYLSLLVWMAL